MSTHAIPMSAGHELVIGPVPPAAPSDDALERFRRIVHDHVHGMSPWDWHALEVEELCELLDQEIDERVARVELLRAVVRELPEQPDPRLHLAEALAEAGDLEGALQVATGLYLACEEAVEAVELIVKLQVHLGLPVESFPWLDGPPRVARLDQVTADRCLRHVQEHGCTEAFDLCFDLFRGEVALFSERELARFLAEDERFDVGFEGGAAFVLPS